MMQLAPSSLVSLGLAILRMPARTRSLRLWGVLPALAARANQTWAAEPPASVGNVREPNIIVVLAHDMGYGDLGV